MGVARQYCGALGKIANCQVAVTAALWTGTRAWCLGAALYLPQAWLTVAAPQRARIPPAVRFQEKWRLGLRLVRQAAAAGYAITAVLADAEFGDVSAFRRALDRRRLPYALGISPDVTVFARRPRLVKPAGRPNRGPARWQMAADVSAISVRVLVAQLPRTAWRRAAGGLTFPAVRAGRARDLHRAVVCRQTEVCALDGASETRNSTTGSDKVELGVHR